MSEEYAVDTDRIYGTGQSMGCMTTLILASEFPDLYAACMFVDGQWDTELHTIWFHLTMPITVLQLWNGCFNSNSL